MPITLSTNRLKIKDGNAFVPVALLREVASTTGFVSPEFYGAIGDGVTDDTEAWQDAVDSGLNVRAISKNYKCGKITVTSNISIDCNNAQFVCTDSILFDCQGTSQIGTQEANYTANGDYSLSDTFTGVVWLSGTNNVFKQRSYYVGGSVEHFHNGVLDTQIPIDITGITAYRLNTIKVNICNISNVTFSDETNAIIINQTYCAYSIIENVNMKNVCYSVVSFSQCFKCSYINSNIDIPQYGSSGSNYYPIAIYDTCYTLIQNIFAHCVGWHCVSTGNHTLCRNTKIVNCEMYTDYGVPAYSDHENGIETLIINSTLSSVGIGNLGRLINCDIVCCKTQNLCHVNLYMSSVNGLGRHVIENCRFYPQDSSYSGVRIYCSPQQSGLTYNYYYNSLRMVNCQDMSSAKYMKLQSGIASAITGATTIEDIYSVNNDITIDLTPTHLYKFPTA